MARSEAEIGLRRRLKLAESEAEIGLRRRLKLAGSEAEIGLRRRLKIKLISTCNTRSYLSYRNEAQTGKRVQQTTIPCCKCSILVMSLESTLSLTISRRRFPRVGVSKKWAEPLKRGRPGGGKRLVLCCHMNQCSD